MNITKYLALGLAVLGMGMTSCVKDLDLEPNDPNYSQGFDPQGVLAKCYSSMAVSGNTGPGSSDISGLDGGTSQYTRTLFMMNEYPTDEVLWIWNDDGVTDLNTNTWNSGNGNIYGCYSRLYSHIAICNDFLRQTVGASDTETQKCRLEARTLRAFSYYWVIDIFGNGNFGTEDLAVNTTLPQETRANLYRWLTNELEDVVAQFNALGTTPAYGHVGVDGAEAILARLYLNAEVYAPEVAQGQGWEKCQKHCANIIARHQGGGFQGSGLAETYHYLFCRDNYEYMPGGGNSAENEILFGLAVDGDYTRSYGTTDYLVLASIATGNIASDGFDMSASNYGLDNGWRCMHAVEQLSLKFADYPNDARCGMWLKGDHGFIITNEDYPGDFFNQGYAVIKFTNLYKGDGDASNGYYASPYWSSKNGGIYDPTGATPAVAESWTSCDLPLIRLADVYLMYAECFTQANVGDGTLAMDYVNLLRDRAGIDHLTKLDNDVILDERARELYWELTRRSDLIRHGKFVGGSYKWNWKGGEAKGTAIAERYALMPIPSRTLAAQPGMVQNPGY